MCASKRFRHFSWRISLSIVAATLVAVLIPADRAFADPPAPRQPAVPRTPPFIPPPVFCFRLTDIVEVGGSGTDVFDFEFEVLNWTNKPADGLEISKAVDVGALVVGGFPLLVGNAVDLDGRFLGLGSDDANFSPFDGTALPGKVGAPNGFAPLITSPTQVRYGGGPPIPFRDLLGAPGTSLAKTTAALGLVPSDPALPNSVNSFGNPVIGNFEAIDNGGFAGDPLPDNVMDGFVLRVADFHQGEQISLNWFLEDAGVQIGTASGGNAYGFGNFNLQRGIDFPIIPPNLPLPATWRRRPGNLFGEGQNRGDVVGGAPGIPPTQSMFTSESANSPAVFVAEMGAAITAPFQDPLDACPDCVVNAEKLNVNPGASPFAGPIFAGHDVWQTNPDQTFLRFDAIPTQPVVRLQGIPTGDPNFQGITGSLDSCGGCDTIVRRLNDLDPLGPPVQTIGIELVELQLQSIDPIDVGAGPETFHIVLNSPGSGILTVDFIHLTMDYQMGLNFDMIGDQGSIFSDFINFQVQGVQFSPEDATKLLLPNVNIFGPQQGLIPLQFALQGNSSINNFTLFQTVDVPDIPGDFNGDGFVDGADYTVWLAAMGSTCFPGSGTSCAVMDADANGDFVVDDQDFQIWKQNFNQGISPGPLSAPVSGANVPEPSALALLLCLAGIGLLAQRRVT